MLAMRQSGLSMIAAARSAPTLISIKVYAGRARWSSRRPARLSVYHRPCLDSARQDLRDCPCNFGFPRGVGSWCQRPRGHQPRRDADAVFALSCAGATLDCRTWRVKATDDLTAGQGADAHVQALLSRRSGLLTPLIPRLCVSQISGAGT
jgi:hypothetical protein